MSSHGRIQSTQSKDVPVMNIAVPGGGQREAIEAVPEGQPVYCGSTGNLVCVGPLSEGVISSAPPGDPDYGKAYTKVVVHSSDGKYIAMCKDTNERTGCSTGTTGYAQGFRQNRSNSGGGGNAWDNLAASTTRALNM